MNNIARLLRHLAIMPWYARRKFPPRALDNITAAVRGAEQSHGGEIRVAIEADLPLRNLLAKQWPRERALEVFAQLRVWDTVARNGVLIYVGLADRCIEIVADRGFDAHVNAELWEQLCRDMATYFQNDGGERAVIHAVETTSKLMAMHYPHVDRNELSDRPALL